MEKVFYLFMFVMTATFCSCSQDSEPVYSCNEAINEWTKENLETIHLMTRSEWNMLEEPKKAAAFRAFSKQQRIRFWHEKLEELKSLDWSQDELEHILLIGLFIDEHQNFFRGEELTDDELDELEKFCYLWIQKGLEKFGWSEKTAISIIATGNTVIDKDGNIMISMTRGGASDHLIDGGDMLDCMCHAKGLGGLYTLCSTYGEFCEETKCVESTLGCGLLLVQSCTGMCF